MHVDKTNVSSVSVIIPAYNRSCVVERAIKSVAGVPDQGPQIVVVDDASSDGTGAAAMPALEAVPASALLRHDQQRGAQGARNTGIRSARGDIIAFLDSDDEYLPHSIDLRLTAMLRENAPVVHSECLVVRHPDPTRRPFGTPPLAGNVYEALLARPGPTYPALMMTRAAIESIGLLDESIVAFQEWDLAIRLAEHHRFAYVPEPTFVYHCHSGETISKDLLRGARGYAQIIEKHSSDIVRHLGKRGLAKHAMQLAEMYASAGDLALAEEQRTKAFRLAPWHVAQRWLRDQLGGLL